MGVYQRDNAVFGWRVQVRGWHQATDRPAFRCPVGRRCQRQHGEPSFIPQQGENFVARWYVCLSCLSVCLYTCSPVCLLVCLSDCLAASLSELLRGCLPILFVYPSVHQSINLSVSCLSIYVSFSKSFCLHLYHAPVLLFVHPTFHSSAPLSFSLSFYAYVDEYVYKEM